MPRLSICIPTYNRAGELPALLDSIVAQSGHRMAVEVVISDNASTDATAEVVRDYADRIGTLVYCRADENMGYDRNLMNAVALASGDYCWTFGSDDKFEPGAFARIEQLLNAYGNLAGASIASCGYKHDLETPMPLYDRIADLFPRDTLLDGVDELVDTIGTSLGSLSGLLVNRKLWKQVAKEEPVEHFYHNYIQIYMILEIAKRNGRWLCVPDRLVGWRSGNDSFAGSGHFKRMKLDVVQYDDIFAAALGKDSAAYRRLMSHVAQIHVRGHILAGKRRGEPLRYWTRTAMLLVPRYWPYLSFWAKVFPILLVPGALVRHAGARRRRHTGQP